MSVVNTPEFAKRILQTTEWMTKVVSGMPVVESYNAKVRDDSVRLNPYGFLEAVMISIRLVQPVPNMDCSDLFEVRLPPAFSAFGEPHVEILQVSRNAADVQISRNVEE